MIGRCINDINLQKFNQGKIKANELVTFDCGLMEGKEIEKSEIDMPQKDKQLLAVIVRPEMEVIRISYISHLLIVAWKKCSKHL